MDIECVWLSTEGMRILQRAPVCGMVCMKLCDFEGQKGVLRLLMYLLSSGKEFSAGAVIQETSIYFRVLMKSLHILEDRRLSKSRIDMAIYPTKRMVSLTRRGRKVPDRPIEIENILQVPDTSL